MSGEFSRCVDCCADCEPRAIIIMEQLSEYLPRRNTAIGFFMGAAVGVASALLWVKSAGFVLLDEVKLDALEQETGVSSGWEQRQKLGPEPVPSDDVQEENKEEEDEP